MQIFIGQLYELSPQQYSVSRVATLLSTRERQNQSLWL